MRKYCSAEEMDSDELDGGHLNLSDNEDDARAFRESNRVKKA